MAKVIIVGDSCLDVHYYCKVERLCPEAPVPIAVPVTKSMNDGMAGNVFKNFQTLSTLKKEDVLFLGSVRSSIKTRYIDQKSGQILIRIDSDEEEFPLQKKEVDKMLEENPDLEMIVISDYNKGLLNVDIISYICDEAEKKNIVIFCDTKKIISSWAKKIFCIKINDKELNINLKEVGNSCLSEPQNFIVTLGKEGALWANKNKTYKAEKITVADTCGCGDTFLAALASRYLETKNLEKAILYANKAASIAATKTGVVTVFRTEIENHLN
jgi:D-beta-D-heptose 7-phosphate kinase/D-beta-D-heptose 1-phosphate adenosyltransferase